MNRTAIRAAAQPPPIFGPRTDILTVIAASGPVRMVALQELFTEMRVAAARNGLDGGICLGWKLPGADRRGQRGAALALDPQHPLYKEVRAVLMTLACNFPFRAERDMTKAETVLPAGKRCHDPDKILFFPNRLAGLCALEALGGIATIAELAGGLSGMRLAVVNQVVQHLVRDRIVLKNGAQISFVEAAWTDPLRRLLRAYMRLRPGLQPQIRRNLKKKRAESERRNANGLFGRYVLERALMILAVRGPIRTGDLEIAATSRKAALALRQLMRLGIVARVERGEGKGRHFVLGLNASHPLYRELRALLCSMAGGKPTPGTPLRVSVTDPQFDGLFVSAQQCNMLLGINAAIHGEIEAASLSRLYPEHDAASMAKILCRWTTDPRGIVATRLGGRMTFYRFNPDYPHLKQLRALLNRIAKVWPDAVAWAQAEPMLYPPKRLAYERKRPRARVR